MEHKKRGRPASSKMLSADEVVMMNESLKSLSAVIHEHRSEADNLAVLLKQVKLEHVDSNGKLLAAVVQIEKNIHGNSELLKSRELAVETMLNDITRKVDSILKNKQHETNTIDTQHELIKSIAGNFVSVSVVVVGLLCFILYRLCILYR